MHGDGGEQEPAMRNKGYQEHFSGGLERKGREEKETENSTRGLEKVTGKC